MPKRSKNQKATGRFDREHWLDEEDTTVRVGPPTREGWADRCWAIEVLSGPELLSMFVFEYGKTTVVGRLPSSDIHITDITISKEHALMSATAAGVEVLDYDSTNGIGIDGVRLNVSTMVSHEARIEFGGVLTRLFLATREEIEARMRLADRLHASSVDPVSGLSPSESLDDIVPDVLRRAKAADLPITALYVGVDGMASRHCDLAPAIRDAVMLSVGRLIAVNLGEDYRALRLLGDEVLCLVLGTEAQALALAEKIRATIEGFEWFRIEHSLDVTVSIGVAQVGADERMAEWLKRAASGHTRAAAGGGNALRLERGLVDVVADTSHVFISYAREDRKFVALLRSRLEEHGVQTWVDEHRMNAGDVMWATIARAVVRADRMIVCCSKSAATSWWVAQEVGIGLHREQRASAELVQAEPFVIPVVLGNSDGLATQFGELSFLLQRSYVDFESWRAQSGFELGFARLLDALGSSRNRGSE